MVNKEFFLALDDLVNEKRIDKQVLLDALEAGLASAYKKEYGDGRGIIVNLNPDTYTMQVIAYRTVVEGPTDDEKEVTLEELKDEMDDLGLPFDYKVGDVIREDVTPKDFSRIAAQTAKGVITQRITEARRDVIMNEMNEKEGEIMTAIIRRIESGTVYVEMTQSQMEGIMMPSDQVHGEKYNVNDVIKVIVKKVRNTTKGAQVVVSRSAANYVRRMFELEVPEIKSGLVSIRGIVREAGYRTKLAVAAEDPNIDPIGACIGTRGIRINSIVSELNGEKIDIIEWCADPLEYIARALSPAKVLMVQVNDESKAAKAIVPDDKLSLAIGKDGQNVRLAHRLTGWKIDVKPFSSIEGTPEADLGENNA